MSGLDYPSYKCHLDWGPIGARRAARRGDIVVIVDVLSFSTAIAVVVERGGKVRPCLESDNALELARQSDGIAAGRRSEDGPDGKYSLSPLTFVDLAPERVVVLPSLNGGGCCRAVGDGAVLFSGCLVNAGAVAEAVGDSYRWTSKSVTVIACGEREGTDGSRFRMALEDYLGAGAILKQLPLKKSPEARICQEAFSASSDNIEQLIMECESGRELADIGYIEDVRFASQLDLYHSVPFRYGRLFERLRSVER